MNGRWKCVKCNSLVSGEKNRCSFCSAPQPADIPSPQIVEAQEADKLAKLLHGIVDKLTPLQKRKLHRYFEDNVL